MKILKDKLKGENGATLNANALKEWCKSLYPKTWMGEKDTDFIDAQTYCKEKIAR